ncbi:N alpha-acetyl-transferase [Malassezia pachydermatis]
MEEMYEANGIWDVRSKRAELQHASSRYLLALPASDAEPASVARVCRRSARHMKGAPDTPTPLYGFIMWRFDTDDTVDGDPCADPGDDEVEVSYCYELQVDAAYRGRHIGTRLLTTLEHVSWRAHMRKVALTVFHMNQGARAFYKQRGYTADVTSPTADTNKEDEVDEVHYMILSTCNPSIKHS